MSTIKWLITLPFRILTALDEVLAVSFGHEVERPLLLLARDARGIGEVFDRLLAAADDGTPADQDGQGK